MADSQFFQAQRDNDGRFSSEPCPNREICFLCHRMIQQEDSTRRWFLDEDAVMGEAYCLTFCDSLDSFQTQQGWCCGSACFNDHTVDPNAECDRCNHAHGAHGSISTACPDGQGLFQEDESIPARPVLFLVKKGTA